MSSQGNNLSGDAAYLRDTFFGVNNFDIENIDKEQGNGEVDYLRKLLSKSDIARKLFKKFRSMPASYLYSKASKLIDSIENGEVKEEDLEYVEAQIALLLGAIEDLQMVKELELTPDYDDKKAQKSHSQVNRNNDDYGLER